MRSYTSLDEKGKVSCCCCCCYIPPYRQGSQLWREPKWQMNLQSRLHSILDPVQKAYFGHLERKKSSL